MVAAATAAGRLILSSTSLTGAARGGRGVMEGMRAAADNVEDMEEVEEAVCDNEVETYQMCQ